MGKIQKLPESLIRLIAAGEVIERPASVIKELVENSLDAHATSISIDVVGAGRTRIRVADDGDGMSPEDAEAALDRHATSKLTVFDDLHQLHTFGFRGEALPSIAAVSRLTLTTRTRDAGQGWEIRREGGQPQSAKAVGSAPGTIIDVQDLFFNTPARDKFLKRDSTERTHILKTIQELALANPSVRFVASFDGKNALTLPGHQPLRGRLADLWGLEVTENLVPLEFAQGPCRVNGFVNAVSAHHPTKTYQSLFINGRPVQQRALTHAIYEAYHEWLPVGRHPVFALFIDLDPEKLDVNVHPSKREVRIAEERALHDLLFKKIRDLFKPAENDPISAVLPHNMPWHGPQTTASYVEDRPLSRQESLEALTLQAPTPSEPALFAVEPPGNALRGEWRFLGIFKKLFVLIERGDELVLVDQHAAAERILYEKFLNQAKTPEKTRHRLLTPVLWELPPDQAEIIREALPDFEALGFVLEAFGGNSFALKEWPSFLTNIKDARKFLEVVRESLSEEGGSSADEPHHERVARAACRAAIKANDTIDTAEVAHLIRELAACERPMTCPHGRPTHIRLTFAELFRRFGRT